LRQQQGVRGLQFSSSQRQARPQLREVARRQQVEMLAADY